MSRKGHSIVFLEHDGNRPTNPLLTVATCPAEGLFSGCHLRKAPMIQGLVTLGHLKEASRDSQGSILATDCKGSPAGRRTECCIRRRSAGRTQRR